MLSADVRTRVARARSQLEKRVRRMLFGSTPSWRRHANALPWFDQPDALTRCAPHARPETDTVLLSKWIRDGYVVVEDAVDPAAIDAMLATLEGLWEAPTAIPGLVLLDLRVGEAAPPRDLAHHELLALPLASRLRIREVSHCRIHGFHYVNAAARRIYFGRRLRDVASGILGRRAVPIAAINFMAGSEQALHQDMAVFHIYPHNHLIGAWIACEDITEASGPLVFYPGSHRTAMFPGFPDYPQTNLRTADPETARRYQEYVEELASRFERRELYARKGQVLLWHGMLIHGGAPVTRPGTSRKSMVLHYSVRGADRGREVEGPFNW